MNKHFTLIVKYISGECAFATDKTDLIEALAEFDKVRRAEFSNAIGDKSFGLPEIISAKLIRIYYVK